MIRQGLYGIAGGLASAVLFYSAVHGGGTWSLALFLLTPLPSVIAGLGWGSAAAASAAAAGAIAMAVVVGPKFAAGYLLALGAPATLLCHLAQLARVDPTAPAAPDWYPAGRLLAAVALCGAAVPILVLPMFGGTYAVLEPAMAEFVRRFFESAGKQMGTPELTPDQVRAFAHGMIDVMPAALAGYWVIIMAINLYLAGKVTHASGLLGRAWPDLRALTIPAALALVLIAAMAALVVPGAPRNIGASVVGGLVVAYALAGLAVIHAIARGTWRLLLWPLYMTLPLIGLYTLTFAALIGIAEPLLRLRDRFGARPLPPPSI